MATALHVSLDDYLSTDYEPDCEYLDGIVEERNVGKRKHSRTQAILAAKLQREIESGRFEVLVEQRVQLSPSKIRIPDVCVITSDNTDEVIQSPPAIWIEILSPEDRWTRVQAKIDDCRRFGVAHLWIIDPYSRQAWSATQTQAMTEMLDGRLHAQFPQLDIKLEDILPES
jgi:Uma2 family endonuclease